MKSHHHVFIAAPMSAFRDDAEYSANRDQVLQLIEHIKTTHHVERVYYAGLQATSSAEFLDPARSLQRDMDALRGADVFVMLYPERIASSVLVEIGYAMALGKPCVILARDVRDLPYLLRNAAQSSGQDGIPPMLIHEYKTTREGLEGLDAALGALTSLQWSKAQSASGSIPK